MFPTWEPTRSVGTGAQPGARALQKAILERHPQARNLGIFAARNIRGGASLSRHALGLAGDTGFPMSSGRGSHAGYVLVGELRAGAESLGVQAIIYDRRIWSRKSPGGRPYTGVNPHYDHVHWELTAAAGQRLTLATARLVLGGSHVVRDLRRGMSGADVAKWQRALGVTADGQFGAKTEAALNAFKHRHGWPQDGVLGPRVRKALRERLPA